MLHTAPENNARSIDQELINAKAKLLMDEKLSLEDLPFVRENFEEILKVLLKQRSSEDVFDLFEDSQLIFGRAGYGLMGIPLRPAQLEKLLSILSQYFDAEQVSRLIIMKKLLSIIVAEDLEEKEGERPRRIIKTLNMVWAGLNVVWAGTKENKENKDAFQFTLDLPRIFNSESGRSERLLTYFILRNRPEEREFCISLIQSQSAGSVCATLIEIIQENAVFLDELPQPILDAIRARFINRAIYPLQPTLMLEEISAEISVLFRLFNFLPELAIKEMIQRLSESTLNKILEHPGLCNEYIMKIDGEERQSFIRRMIAKRASSLPPSQAGFSLNFFQPFNATVTVLVEGEVAEFKKLKYGGGGE